MEQTWSRTVVVMRWSAPLALLAVMMLTNAGLAGTYARVLAASGAGHAGPGAGAGYWAWLFAALALTDLPALVIVSRWSEAVTREQAARDEILAAVRWSPRLDRWQPRLWAGVAAPVARPADGPRLGTLLRWHLPYAGGWLLSLALPLLLAGLLAGG